MSGDHGPLDVIQVRVVLQGALQKTGLLAKLGNMGAVVVSEHLIAKDSISHLERTCNSSMYSRLISEISESESFKNAVTDLRSMHEVHLQEAGLQRSLRGTIVLQSIKQEGSALLHHIGLHEHIHNLQQTTDPSMIPSDAKGQIPASLTWLISAKGSSSCTNIWAN